MQRYFLLLSAICVLCLPLPARADIGTVGAPDAADNNPPPQPTPRAKHKTVAAAAAPVQEEKKPLLVIHFNQHHVYFEKTLRKAVEAAEQTKGGVFYQVVSYVPAGNSGSQTQRIEEVSQANLNAVMNEFQALGVPSSRVSASTQPAPAGVTSQEVHISTK